MKRKIELTEDGSHTLFLPEMDEHFHSTHGAIQESMHVFIKNGLKKTSRNPLVIFEVGFGTGLNALLSLIHRDNRTIQYYSIENYPLKEKEYTELNYAEIISPSISSSFLKMHQCPWEELVEIEPGFQLRKIKADLTDFRFENIPPFDLVYFDAFAPGKQPEMWTDTILGSVSKQTSQSGIFTTYTAKGEVRRSLTKHGFRMQRVPGPPGKKEILVGEKA